MDLRTLMIPTRQTVVFFKYLNDAITRICICVMMGFPLIIGKNYVFHKNHKIHKIYSP